MVNVKVDTMITHSHTNGDITMAYISTDEVKAIRQELKKEFGKDVKFSVRRNDGGLSVAVSIMKSKVDMSEVMEGNTHVSVNQYHIDEHYADHPKQRDLLNKVHGIIKTAPAKADGGREWFDESDAMTDYFHTAFYYDISIGQWDKPYEVIV